MRLSPWTSPRKPPSARYTAANFDPSLVIPETTPRLAVAAASRLSRLHGAGLRQAPPRRSTRRRPGRSGAPAAAAPSGPSIGSWVIQVGSFSDSQAAQLALERASAALPDSIRSHGAASRRRGADGQQDLPPRPAHQPLAGSGGRRLQAARDSARSTARRSRSPPGIPRERAERRLQAGEERPLVAALPERQIPWPPLGWKRSSTGSNTDTVVIAPPIRTLSGAMR